MRQTTVSERGLVLAPRGRDALIGAAMLEEAGLSAAIVTGLPGLIAELDHGAGFVVVTEEALATPDMRPLADWIEAQEEWSDLPFILLTNRGGGLERNPAAARYLEVLSNVTFVERPFHPTTLVSLCRAALRGRRRQYEARSRLVALREGEQMLRDLNASLERRVAEALAERKLFADIVTHTDASFQVLDQEFRFLAINPSAVDDYRRFFDATAQVGLTLHEVLAHVPDQRDAAVAVWRRALAGEVFEETSWWRPAGLPARAYEMQVRPLSDAEGRQIGAYLFGREVTDRLRDQERLMETTAQLHEAQKLETLGQLTGGVAHDFNNLLTPIMGALDLVRRRVPADKRTTQLLDGALQSSERAKTLVQRLLGFARRQTLETRAVDLGQLVTDMRDLIASSVGAKVELRFLDTGDNPPAVVDPAQLELAILNLCVNARDAMPDGGRLTIALEGVVLAAGEVLDLAPGAYQRLSVSDTGTGMDPATLKRAVEPFYSTKGIGRGTGLGLSMVHGLAAQLGGAFVLASTPGEGTRAELYLPAADAGMIPAVSRATGGAGAGACDTPPMKVLLVDDEPLVRAGTAEMLREMGHSVIEATGGLDALRQLESGIQVQALLTDYMMPQMDGAALARRVLEGHPAMPILVMTGYAGGDLEIGLPMLAKPFRQADLARALFTLGNAPAAEGLNS